MVAAKNGFLLLFQLFKNNREQLHPLKEFMSRKRMKGMEIWSTVYWQYILQRVKHYRNLLNNLFYAKSFTDIQWLHLEKWKRFTIDTQIFYWRAIYSFYWYISTRNTSPRMNALQNLMFDLQIIDDQKVLLPLHKKLLNN